MIRSSTRATDWALFLPPLTLLTPQRSRELSEAELRKAIGDEAPRPWDNSLVRLLEQEGVILRIESEVQGQYNVIPVYDAIGAT